MLRSESSCWADEVEAEEAETGASLPQPIDMTISDNRHQPTSPVYGAGAQDTGRGKEVADGRDSFGRRPRVDGDARRGMQDGGARFGGRGGGGQGRGGGGRTRGEGRGGLPPRKPAWEPPAIPSEESRAARPRLKLKPRSEQAGSVGQSGSGSSSIFGDARPIDTTAKLAALDVRESKSRSNTKSSETKVGKGEKAAMVQSSGRKVGKETAKAPPVLRVEQANPTKLDNPFDLLSEE